MLGSTKFPSVNDNNFDAHLCPQFRHGEHDIHLMLVMQE